MDVASNAFNRHLGIEASDGPERSLSIPDDPRFQNHRETVHAAAQFALAEASSGDRLLDALGGAFPNAFAVVRRFEGKFRDPLRGRATARAEIVGGSAAVADRLSTRGRAMVTVHVEVRDDAGRLGLGAAIEWYIQVAPDQGPVASDSAGR